jgi:alkaline phosphatase D
MKRTVLCLLGMVALSLSASAAEYEKISSWDEWERLPERRWLGSGFWGNRLQDWQVRDGKLVYTSASLRMPKTVHSLKWQAGTEHKPFRMKTTVTIPCVANKGFAGFLVGAGQGKLDWRGASTVSGTPGTGGGIMATIDFQGENALHIRNNNDSDPVHLAKPFSDEVTEKVPSLEKVAQIVVLLLESIPQEDGTCTLRLECWNAGESKLLGAVEKSGIPSADLAGNIGLVAHGGKVGSEVTFGDWQVGGDRLLQHKGRGFGPVAGALYALSGDRLKIGVQLIPLGVHGSPVPDNLKVDIQKKGTLRWKTIASETLSTDDYHQLFVFDGWDGSRPAKMRVVFKDLDGTVHTYPFTVQAEPKPGASVSCAAYTGMGANGLYAQTPNPEPGSGEMPIGKWTSSNVWFPFEQVVERSARSEADILFFTGDQIYENRPSKADPSMNPVEDYLYKFLMWHWAFQDITSTHPSILQTDDHDVYHGDLFGEDKLGNTQSDQHGGYHKSREFVNMVHKTMTSHLPDTLEPAPSKRTGLTNYYTTFDYGDVSFFVLEDRKFKKGAKSSDADYPETYLGYIQLDHLRKWCETPMPGKRKCLVAQTIYAAMSLSAEGTFPYDWDVNAMYVDERNEIVKMLADANAVILCGDQHLCTFSRLGYTDPANKGKAIKPEEYSNGPYQFSVPPVGNVFWRWFYPADGVRELDHTESDLSYVGGFRDFFGNPFTMLAVANPEREELQKQGIRIRYLVTADEAADNAHLKRTCKGDGFGILRFDMENLKMVAEAWPLDGDEQFLGFPQVVPFSSIDQ